MPQGIFLKTFLRNVQVILNFCLHLQHQYSQIMNSYFYLDENNQQKGPISPMQFNVYGVTARTMVWCNGMSDWRRAGDVPELAEFVNASSTESTVPPNPPHASAGTYTNQAYGATQPPMGVCPDTNLVWGILCTICCCLPLGIVSIVYACKVKDLFYAGNVAGAVEASRNARNWAIYGLIASVVINFFYGIYILVCGAASLATLGL